MNENQNQNFQNNLSQSTNNLNNPTMNSTQSSYPGMNYQTPPTWNNQKAPNPPTSKKKIDKKLWMEIGIALFFLFIVIMIILSISNQKEDSAKINTDVTCEEPEVVPMNITYEDFSFQVSTDYSIIVKDEYLEITDNENWSFSISLLPYAYSSLDVEEVKNNFVTGGYENVSVNEQTIDDRSYIVAAITKDGVNSVVVYTKASYNSIFGVEIYMKDNTFGTNRLNIVHEIIKTAVEQ